MPYGYDELNRIAPEQAMFMAALVQISAGQRQKWKKIITRDPIEALREIYSNLVAGQTMRYRDVWIQNALDGWALKFGLTLNGKPALWVIRRAKLFLLRSADVNSFAEEIGTGINYDMRKPTKLLKMKPPRPPLPPDCVWLSDTDVIKPAMAKKIRLSMSRNHKSAGVGSKLGKKPEAEAHSTYLALKICGATSKSIEAEFGKSPGAVSDAIKGFAEFIHIDPPIRRTLRAGKAFLSPNPVRK